MSNAADTGLNKPIEEARSGAGSEDARPRAVGSPLPIGSGSSSTPAAKDGPQRTFAPPPPERTLANPANAPAQPPSGIQRAVGVFRAALPFVQRILPLLDGNVGTAVSNILTPHHHAPPPAPPVNLAPIQDSLAALQTQHVELRNQVTEQNSSLKRVEDQLEQVREATDRNTLEQQELVEDLKGVGNRVNLFALIALGLLAVSVAINVVLYLHIVRVLP